MRLVRQRCSAAGPAFVLPPEPGVPVPPDSLSSHSFLPQSEGTGGPGTLAFIAQRVVSWDMLRRFAHSPLRRGQPGPRAVVLAPGAPTAYRAPRPSPIVPPLGHALLSLARGRWRLCDRRGGQIPRTQRSGLASSYSLGPVWKVAFVVRRGWSSRPPNSFPGPSRQPFAKCLLSANKGKISAPSPPAPTSEPERECASPSGFFCAQTFRPRSLNPTSFTPLTSVK